MSGQLPDAVERTRVKPVGRSMRLGLQPDSDMLDWRGKKSVGNACKGAGGVVLPVSE